MTAVLTRALGLDQQDVCRGHRGVWDPRALLMRRNGDTVGRQEGQPMPPPPGPRQVSPYRVTQVPTARFKGRGEP